MGLFEGVFYYVVENNVKNLASVKHLMKQEGASREFYMSELVTHVISDVPDPETTPTAGQDHVSVHSDWVVMSHKCGAQLPTVPFEPAGGKVFSDLVFCPSKLSVPDVEKLCVLLLFNGGKMQRRLDSKVTHLVTMETSGAKYECARSHSALKVVSPDWILDSIEANKRLEEEVYHPSHLKPKETEYQMSAGTCNGAESAEGGVTVQTLSSQTKPNDIVATPLQGEGVAIETSLPVIEAAVPQRPALQSADSAAKNGEGARGGEATPTGVRSEQLLDGVVIYFTDYQDCVEDHTLDKWKLVVTQHGGQVLDVYDSNRCTHLLALHKMSSYFTQAMEEKKCIASAHWLNDVLTEQKMFPPRNPIHFPTAFQWQLPNAQLYSMTLTNYTDVERELVKDMLHICGLPYTGHLSRENTHLICKRPEGKKYEKALEWGVQVVNSTFLADIIHKGHLPAALFPRYTELNQPSEFLPENSVEASRMLELWKPFIKRFTKLHPQLVNSSLVPPQEEAAFPVGGKRSRDESTSVEGPRDKLRRVERNSPPPPTVLFTGINTAVAKDLKQIVVRLGGVVTDNAQDCTHIVTPRVARTIKFLSGISVCRHVVVPRWVEESGNQAKFKDEAEFVLRDTDAEQLFGMELATSLTRARERKLLEGVCIYATPNVQPAQAALGEIVRCAGGKLVTLPQVRALLVENGAMAAGVIILSTPEDIASGYCKEFTSRNIKICNAELILTGVLKQALNYPQHTFVLN